MSTSECSTYQSLTAAVSRQEALVEACSGAVRAEQIELLAYEATEAAAKLALAGRVAAHAAAAAAAFTGAPAAALALEAAELALEIAQSEWEKAAADKESAERSLQVAKDNAATAEAHLAERQSAVESHAASCSVCTA